MAKSKPALNLVSLCVASSPTAPSSSASSRPEILRGPSQQESNLRAQCAGKPADGVSNQNDAASSTKVWVTDAKFSESARKLAAADTNQDQSFQERARKLAAENLDINDEDDSKWPHNLRISRADESTPTCDNDSNASQKTKWRNPMYAGMFMVVTQQAAVHLGNDIYKQTKIGHKEQ